MSPAYHENVSGGFLLVQAGICTRETSCQIHRKGKYLSAKSRDWELRAGFFRALVQAAG